MAKRKNNWIGIFGGSFDPPHLGHLLAAIYALNVFEFDEIWFVPSHQHPFQKKLTRFQDRVAMCKKLIQGLGSKFKVNLIEADPKLDGKTLHTLLALRKKYPSHHFSLVMGSDLLKQKRKWYRFSEIENRFGVYAVPRGKGEKDEFVIPNISSTEIRRRIRRKKSLDTLLTPQVASYVLTKKLYSP